MTDDPEPAAVLLQRLRQGDEPALAELFSQHRDRLWRMVHFRLDRRLLGRVDAEDVLQEAYLNAVKRIGHCTAEAPSALFIWLRMIVTQTLIDVHRRHVGAQRRDAGREIAAHGPRDAFNTTVSLAANLLGGLTSPTLAARRAEMAERLQGMLESMDPIDREVLVLRHFEELTNREVAEELGIQQKAASIRYVRAVKRLKEIMSRFPGSSESSHHV